MISIPIILPLLGLTALIFILRALYSIFYNIYYHPLSKFPGPKIAGATRLYQSYFDVLKKHGGQYVYEIERLHRIYGKSNIWASRIEPFKADRRNLGSIVRIAPGEVHIDDLDFYDTLYALGVKRDKDPLHTQIFGTPLSCKILPTPSTSNLG